MRRIILTCTVLVLATVSHAATPQLINYQGNVTDNLGSPVPDGLYSVAFTVYDAAVAGSAVWTETQIVTSSTGLFAVLLGSVNPISDIVFNGTTRYLGIAVSGDPELSPRTALVSVPYAQRVNTVDGASGGTITSKVAIGSGHINTGANSFVAGVNNNASGQTSTVGGGVGNAASGESAVVGGGNGNSANGIRATVGGGESNAASGEWTTISGGFGNSAKATFATVSGGTSNLAKTGATVGGGVSNDASGIYSVISGGGGADVTDGNIALGENSVISGGKKNTASSFLSIVGGGFSNNAIESGTTIGGGFFNSAEGSSSTVAGGSSNTASGGSAVVSGGSNNKARGMYSVVGGGGGGASLDSNLALGLASTVPGGKRNIAAGDFSLAAGLRAQANHTGTFVWADSSNTDFASTAQDQFLIRAGGGVGINKNDPQAPLDIKSVFGSGQEILRLSMERAWAFRQSSAGANTKLELKSLSAGATKHFLITTDGNVGISTTNPTQKLYVSGNICATGTIAACSDARYKKDVVTLSNSLSNVMQLRGVSYRWRQSEYPDHNFDGETHLGFIAQEIEKLYPEMVLTDADGYKSVDYGRLTPVLVEAIQDQQEQIDELRSMVNQLVTATKTSVTLSKK